MPTIGFLHAGSLDGYANHTVAFRQGLNDAGFVPNQNVAIEYRWASGQYERLPALAFELAGREVAVLVASGGHARRARGESRDHDHSDRLHVRRRPGADRPRHQPEPARGKRDRCQLYLASARAKAS